MAIILLEFQFDLIFVCYNFLDPLSCGSPDSLQNTTVSGKNYTNGASITYSCPIGHALIGNETRKCENGIWSGKAPTCKCKFEYRIEFDAMMESVNFNI